MADEFEQFKRGASTGGDEFAQYQRNGPGIAAHTPTLGERATSFVKDTASAAAPYLNPANIVSGVYNTIRHPIDTMSQMATPPHEQIPEEQLPQDAFHRIQRKLGGGPNYNPPGKDAPMSEVLGTGLGIGLSGSVPGVIGKGMRAAGPPLAESSLGIRAINRAYGRTPGVAALEETKGFNPGTVSESAQQRLGDINTELESVVGKSNAPVDITPARQVLSAAQTKASGRNAAKTASQIDPMKQHLTEPMPGFQGRITQPPTPMVQKPSAILGPNGQPVMQTVPGQAPPPVISDVQNPTGVLNLKRGFGDEFIHNWNPETMKGVRGTAARTYHALGEQLHNAVPESAPLDTRASSLIPVAERGAAADLNAPIGQRIMHRIGAHTGALAGAGLGYATGGIPGGIAGLVLPELLSSPTVKMAIARTLYGGGKALQSPAARDLARIGALAPRKQENQ